LDMEDLRALGECRQGMLLGGTPIDFETQKCYN